LRLDVRCDLSARVRGALERGELDLALLKRGAGEGDAIAAWPERLRWVSSRDHPIDPRRDPVPLVVSEQGCLYRNHAIHTLEAAGRSWHVAFSSPNLSGLQAAISAGLGLGILPDQVIQPDHRVLGAKDGLAPLAKTELALCAAPGANPSTHRLAAVLADFCSATDPRAAA